MKFFAIIFDRNDYRYKPSEHSDIKEWFEHRLQRYQGYSGSLAHSHPERVESGHRKYPADKLAYELELAKAKFEREDVREQALDEYLPKLDLQQRTRFLISLIGISA